MLDLTALRNAVAQLAEALDLCASELAASDARLARHLRAAAIRAFEYTYELSVKMLRRTLREADPDPSAVDQLSFNDLVRRGWGAGLLEADLAAWKGFRRSRGTTSHAYDEERAQAVFADVPAFLAEARSLLARLEQRAR